MPALYRRFTPLAVTLASMTFALIVLGALTRAMGAGLACPDWPFCNGKLIPTFEGGVFYEWLHRLVAACVSLVFLGMAGWIAWAKPLRSRLGPWALAAIVLLGIQIVLGGLTVLKLLDSRVVTFHLATGTLLFGTFLVIALRARAAATGYLARRDQPRGLRGLAIATLLGVFGQVLLGGVVASNYAAWACPDWPTCQGTLFPPLVGYVGLHMIHRDGAYLLTVLVLACWWIGRRSPDTWVRRGCGAMLVLVLVQFALGVANVLWHIPPGITAAHNACGEALFATATMVNFALFAVPRTSRFAFKQEAWPA